MENNFYNCNEKYYSDCILEEDMVGLNDNTKLYKEKVEDIMYKLFLEREKAAADKILDFYAYPENHRIDGSGLEDFIMWNDYGNSDPSSDIKKGHNIIRYSTGLNANTIIISKNIFNLLKLNKKFNDYKNIFKSRNMTEEDVIASFFDVDQILIGDASIWGNSVILCYIAAEPNLKNSSFCYNFIWKKNNKNIFIANKYGDISRRCIVIDVVSFYDQKIICNGAGYLLLNVI